MEDEFNVDNKYLHQETDSRKFRLTYLCNSKALRNLNSMNRNVIILPIGNLQKMKS